MRVINLISVNGGIVHSIESFGIFGESSFNDVTEDEKFLKTIVRAESRFRAEAVLLGAKEPELENHVEDGYYSGMNFSINLVWSEI